MIASSGTQLKAVEHGIIRTTSRQSDAERLRLIFEGLQAAINAHHPDKAVIEEIFVNANPRSALRLGLARGVAMLACGQAGLALSEISPRKVKQAVTGTGTADKTDGSDGLPFVGDPGPAIRCGGCAGYGDRLFSGRSHPARTNRGDGNGPVRSH